MTLLPISSHTSRWAHKLALAVLLPLITGIAAPLASAQLSGIEEIRAIGKIRIACVGDSITEGHNDPANSWPFLLEKLINQKARGAYEIGNFGKGGATLIKASKSPYWEHPEFQESLEFLPDVVIINLGINDAHHFLWDGSHEQFYEPLTELVQTYQSLPTQPVVWLSHLTTMYPTFQPWEASQDYIAMADQVVDAVAREMGLGVLQFGAATAGNSGLFPDGLHPDRTGNWLMAQEAFESLKGSEVISLIPGQQVLVETESFSEYGGWVNDSQFMDLMGSPFLLAHGMGTPVADASTEIFFPTSGTYRVWVRTRDWVAPWGAPGAPGQFQVLINGEAIPETFGTEGAEWHWQDGGTIAVDEEVQITLRDLTGFEGRCDAILFCKNLDEAPPANVKMLAEYRRQALNLPNNPEYLGNFDLVVVGGGVAGTSAAVTSARLGLRVALIQDRPILGGNSSSEVRVWPEGHTNQLPYPHVGDVVTELVPERTDESHNAQSASIFDDDRKLRAVQAESNITLFLGQRMNAIEMERGQISSVIFQDVRSGKRSRLRGRSYLDSTGDAALGFLAGADYEVTETGHMGASNLWNIQCLCEDEDALAATLEEATEQATFPRCPWAVDLSNKPFPGREKGAKTPETGQTTPISLGNWFWENGFDRDPIYDMERIRDQNFRAMYGAWDAIKNVEKRYPVHRLNWVAYVAGKRESRRLLGDVILTAENLRDGTVFEDGCFPCTWGIDTHFPDPKYKEGHEGDEFIADYTHGEGYEYQGPYWAPYRTLYSRNIENLFMAGRNISVTHEALGAVRVMKTTGMMGEIVGMAAALCKRHDCSPSDVHEFYLDDLKKLMTKGAGLQTSDSDESDDY